jgi:hypothetical protein
MIDIVIPLGPGSIAGDKELRIALRSISRYAENLRRVWVVGHSPGWFRETDVYRLAPRPEFKCPKESRISLKILWAFENLEISDRVAFWNDDYVLTKTCDIENIKPFYSGDLWTKRASPWGRARRSTYQALAEAGLPTKNYDIHMPIVFEREKYTSLRKWWDKGYVGKSVYGNHMCAGKSSRTADCKLWKGWKSRVDERFRRRFVVSYGNTAARRGLIRWLLERFPEECEAEK